MLGVAQIYKLPPHGALSTGLPEVLLSHPPQWVSPVFISQACSDPEVTAGKSPLCLEALYVLFCFRMLPSVIHFSEPCKVGYIILSLATSDLFQTNFFDLPLVDNTIRYPGSFPCILLTYFIFFPIACTSPLAWHFSKPGCDDRRKASLPGPAPLLLSFLCLEFSLILRSKYFPIVAGIHLGKAKGADERI